MLKLKGLAKMETPTASNKRRDRMKEKNNFEQQRVSEPSQMNRVTHFGGNDFCCKDQIEG